MIIPNSLKSKAWLRKMLMAIFVCIVTILSGCVNDNGVKFDIKSRSESLYRILDHFNELEFIDSPIHPYIIKATIVERVPGKNIGLTSNGILAPPPTTFAVKRRLGHHARLSFRYGIANTEWPGANRAVRFEVYCRELSTGMPEKFLFSDVVRKKHRFWFNADIDLDEFAGKHIALVFKTSLLNGLSDKELRAVWGNPVIVEPDDQKGINVILMSIDALRADHLSCYGYSRNTSPAVDALARDGILFKTVISQAPYTLASHMSILTSLYPSFHKVYDVETDVLDPKIMTVAQILYNHGYRTAAFTGGGQMSEIFGFSKGFESYYQDTSKQGDIRRKVKEIITFIDRINNQRFFIFMHTYHVHAPYDPAPPYDTMFEPEHLSQLTASIDIIKAINEGSITLNKNDISHLIALYDGLIREADSQLDTLFKFLKHKDLQQTTLVILTADHGEEFGEHGKYCRHSHSLYDELLRVPLIMKLPSGFPSKQIITTQVQSIDIVPTILDIAGINSNRAGLQGRSLLPLIRDAGESQEFEYAFSEKLSENISMRAARTPLSKFIVQHDKRNNNTLYYYFDLRTDPHEQHVIIPSKNVQNNFLNKMKFLLDEEKKTAKTTRKNILDKETLEALRALGYIK